MYHTDNLDGDSDAIHPIEGNDFLGVGGAALAVVSDNEENIHVFRPDGDGVKYTGVMSKYAFTEYDTLSSTYKSDLLKYVRSKGYEVTNVD